MKGWQHRQRVTPCTYGCCHLCVALWNWCTWKRQVQCRRKLYSINNPPFSPHEWKFHKPEDNCLLGHCSVFIYRNWPRFHKCFQILPQYTVVSQKSIVRTLNQTFANIVPGMICGLLHYPTGNMHVYSLLQWAFERKVQNYYSHNAQSSLCHKKKQIQLFWLLIAHHTIQSCT
jgi:hypothetical protein